MTHRYDGNGARSARLRCLSVKDPWAEEIASGKKNIELRSYPVPLGPLGICSTASGGRPGRLLCIVDVVEVLPPDDPWLASQGVRGLHGLVLDNARAGKVRPVVSGQQRVWTLDVAGDWADLAEAEARGARKGQDRRTRADKLRDLANHPTATKGERDNALAELAKMEKAAVEAAVAKGPCPKPPHRDVPASDLEERARRFEESGRRRAEDRARKERAEAEARAKAQAERDASDKATRAWAAAEHQRMTEPLRKAEEARVKVAAAEAKDLADRAALLERSPFRIRGGGDPKDSCPACGAANALAIEAPGTDIARRRFRCGGCGQGFGTIKTFGEIWMYRKDDGKRPARNRF